MATFLNPKDVSELKHLAIGADLGQTTSGRDFALEGIKNAVGPHLNMLICQMKLNKEARLLELVARKRNEYLETLPYQHTSLTDIKHNLKLS